MFVQACNQIRECIYGLMGLSQVDPNQLNITNCTGFMIAPGVLVTGGHFCYVDDDPTKPVRTRFDAIRSPDIRIGQSMETAIFMAADARRDIALLRLDNPRSTSCVHLECNQVPTGTSCGSLGFPLASVASSPSGPIFNVFERFQGASISAYRTSMDPAGPELDYYETDSFMYAGSSGCPGFLADARVFGMHRGSMVDSVSAQANAAHPNQVAGNRLAISIWATAADIRDFAIANGVQL